MDPAETYLFISSVFKRASALVSCHRGTISSFSGDGFLAQFGSTAIDGFASDTAEADAVKCAIGLRHEISQINLTRHSDHQFTFLLGIGIHSGIVAGGRMNLGDREFELVLGDTVNTASRIESLCKFFSVDILVSDTVEAAVRDQFQFLSMAPKELRGKSGKHKTFWVLPTNQPTNPPALNNL